MIAIVYPQFYGIGGIARYLDSFLNNLPTHHAKVYLITGDEHRLDKAYGNVEIIHIPFKSNRFSLAIWSYQARKVVFELYKKGLIKVINLHIPPLITGIMLSSSIPMVLTAHTTYLGMSGQFYSQAYFISQWNRVEIYLKRLLETYIFRRATSIITLTEQGRAELDRYPIQKKSIEIIPNGVDIEHFAPDNPIPKIYDILFCGRIEKRKGSRKMVEICEELIHILPSIKIVIAGYGDDENYVKSIINKYQQNIEYKGKVNFNSMHKLYAQSKLYVSTTYYEGLPGTCLEAMAMGLPAIVWDFAFYHHLVIPNQTGLLIPPNDNTAMVKAINDYLAKKITLLPSEAITDHVRQHYNWRKLAAKVWTVLTKHV